MMLRWIVYHVPSTVKCWKHEPKKKKKKNHNKENALGHQNKFIYLFMPFCHISVLFMCIRSSDLYFVILIIIPYVHWKHI